jgi:hypothetical protein
MWPRVATEGPCGHRAAMATGRRVAKAPSDGRGGGWPALPMAAGRRVVTDRRVASTPLPGGHVWLGRWVVARLRPPHTELPRMNVGSDPDGQMAATSRCGRATSPLDPTHGHAHGHSCGHGQVSVAKSCGHAVWPRMTATAWWPRSGGHGLVATTRWPRCGGHGLVATVWWPRSGGHGLVATVWWPRSGGHDPMATVWWPRPDGHGVVATRGGHAGWLRQCLTRPLAWPPCSVAGCHKARVGAPRELTHGRLRGRHPHTRRITTPPSSPAGPATGGFKPRGKPLPESIPNFLAT